MEGFVLGVAVAIVKISGDCHDGGLSGTEISLKVLSLNGRFSGIVKVY